MNKYFSALGIFSLLSCSALLLVGNLRADEIVVYRSDFSVEKSGWSGRAGESGRAPKVIAEEDPMNLGTTLLKVHADGSLGCGFRFFSSAALTPKKSYTLTFKICTSAPITLTGRISTKDFAGYGEDIKSWFLVGRLNADEWREVTHAFAPISSSIGFEIGVNSKQSEPCSIFIKDVRITTD